MVYCVVLISPSADPQRSRVHINKIETQTAINYIIAPNEYQALSWGPAVGLFGFPAQVNTVIAEKLYACTVFDISNIWPLKVNVLSV